MDRRYLPMFKVVPPQEGSIFERREQAAEKIGQAFLRQEYPLTPAGKELKERVGQLLKQGLLKELGELILELPTVEHPHLELFADLTIDAASERELFGYRLFNIQVTKGCRHTCTFCAAGAEGKVEMMPFAAVLKIAEKKRKWDNELHEDAAAVWQEYKNYLAERGISFEQEYGRISEILREEHEELEHEPQKRELLEILRACVAAIKENELDPSVFFGVTAALRKRTGPVLVEYLEVIDQRIRRTQPKELARTAANFLVERYEVMPASEQFGEFVRILAGVLMQSLLEDQDDVHQADLFYRFAVGAKLMITNYYGSDVFDFRDKNFLHLDGTPADFGDVFAAIASVNRPIHITTAGWPKGDHTAERAAQKIVAVCQKSPLKVVHPRISITKYDITARRGFGRYREAMMQVIDTLAPLKPKYLFFYRRKEKPARGVPSEPVEEDVPFDEEVIQQLERHIFTTDPAGLDRVIHYPVSFYSGPMAGQGTDTDSDHDVMSCMPGYHFWPNGVVAEQKALGPEEEKRFDDQQTAFGSRPTPTGLRLFEKIKG